MPTQPAPVKPLIEAPEFIRNRKHWGAAFRFGFVHIGTDDFARITAAMQCDFAHAAAEPATA